MAEETFRNAEGSTGTMKDGQFAPFKSQAEADKSTSVEPPEPLADPEAVGQEPQKPSSKK